MAKSVGLSLIIHAQNKGLLFVRPSTKFVKPLSCGQSHDIFSDHEHQAADAPSPRAKAMTPEPRDQAVENALLRASLFLTARALKDYQDAPAFEIDDDGRPMLEVIVPESLRTRAADALARAEKMLKEPEQGRGR